MTGSVSRNVEVTSPRQVNLLHFLWNWQLRSHVFHLLPCLTILPDVSYCQGEAETVVHHPWKYHSKNNTTIHLVFGNWQDQICTSWWSPLQAKAKVLYWYNLWKIFFSLRTAKKELAWTRDTWTSLLSEPIHHSNSIKTRQFVRKCYKELRHALSQYFF